MIPTGSVGVDLEKSGTSVHTHSTSMQRVLCRDRSTDRVALYGEVDGSYMDGMLPLMIGGKDDTKLPIGSGGVDLERSGISVHARSTTLRIDPPRSNVREICLSDRERDFLAPNPHLLEIALSGPLQGSKARLALQGSGADRGDGGCALLPTQGWRGFKDWRSQVSCVVCDSP